LRPNYHLVDTAKPMETASDVYRFEIKVPSNGALDFPVTEENVYDQQTSVSSMTPDNLLVYIRNKALSDAAKRQLQQVADVKTQIANIETERRKLDTDVQSIARDEERNRQNIASLSNVSGQQQIVQDYARKLSDQETQIAKARDRQAALDSERLRLQGQLNTLIGKLDF
jgi:chromosome segregation ATPase